MKRVVLMALLTFLPAAGFAVAGEDIFTATAAAQPDLPPGVGQGRGVLHRVDAGLGLVFISYETIPQLDLAPMTRDLKLASRDMAAGLAPGMSVRFQLQQRGPNDYVIIQIKPLNNVGADLNAWPQ